MARIPVIVRKGSIWLLLAVLLVLAGIGAVSVAAWCKERWSRNRIASFPTPVADRIPISKRPGPRTDSNPMSLVLSAANAQRMKGADDPVNERWCDIAGNYYSSDFTADFSYERPCRRQPQVLVRIEPRSDTFRGRLEAQRLKPNFAYQIKLRGIFRDRASFETIGRLGRWRLPGRGTNYGDQDYLDYPDKAAVEAYLFFDYFVTDRNGNAVKDFALDSSLHVLWNASRQGGEPEPDDLTPVVVAATDPAVYNRPKRGATVERVWAEREGIRYRHRDEAIRLPPGTYLAELVLTEESFHARDNDGGFWATVYSLPVTFAIAREEGGKSAPD